MYLKEEYSNTIIIDKSKFICYLNYCDNELSYKNYLAQIRKKHYDASHICSAFISKDIKRSSDDGEPSGTAGVPILSTLEKNNMDNICCLVVRHFGGIKLGAGGLIRAYSSAVSQCLKIAQKYDNELMDKYSLKLNYSLSNKVDYFIRNNTYLIDVLYEEDVIYIFACNDLNILDNINEYTRGIKATKIGEELIERKINL